MSFGLFATLEITPDCAKGVTGASSTNSGVGIDGTAALLVPPLEPPQPDSSIES